jgi:hypothetical protein
MVLCFGEIEQKSSVDTFVLTRCGLWRTTEIQHDEIPLQKSIETIAMQASRPLKKISLRKYARGIPLLLNSIRPSLRTGLFGEGAKIFAQRSPQLIEKKKEAKHTSSKIIVCFLRGRRLEAMGRRDHFDPKLDSAAASVDWSNSKERASCLRRSEEDVYQSAKGSFAAVTAGGCSVESG